MNLLEADLFDSLRNLEDSDVMLLGNQSKRPEIRGVSLSLGSWLFLALESEYERRHNREHFDDVLDLAGMTDNDVAGAFHASLILLDAQISDKASDFVTRLLRLVGAHACVRLQLRHVALSN